MEHLLEPFPLGHSTIHGEDLWMRVLYNGRMFAIENKANLNVINLLGNNTEQEINFGIRNELTIKPFIEAIPNYQHFFITISPECGAQLKKTKDGLKWIRLINSLQSTEK